MRRWEVWRVHWKSFWKVLGKLVDEGSVRSKWRECRLEPCQSLNETKKLLVTIRAGATIRWRTAAPLMRLPDWPKQASGVPGKPCAPQPRPAQPRRKPKPAQPWHISNGPKLSHCCQSSVIFGFSSKLLVFEPTSQHIIKTKNNNEFDNVYFGSVSAAAQWTWEWSLLK